MTPSRQPISFVATADPEAALAFYGHTVGLGLLEHSDYALVFADGQNMLRVQIVQTYAAPSHTVHGWQVVDIEAEIADLASQGVGFSMFEHLPQNAQGVWTTPDGHMIAWFNDPSGNVLSLTQFLDPVHRTTTP